MNFDLVFRLYLLEKGFLYYIIVKTILKSMTPTRVRRRSLDLLPNITTLAN